MSTEQEEVIVEPHALQGPSQYWRDAVDLSRARMLTDERVGRASVGDLWLTTEAEAGMPCMGGPLAGGPRG